MYSQNCAAHGKELEMKTLFFIVLLVLLGLGYMLFQSGRDEVQMKKMQKQLAGIESQLRQGKADALHSLSIMRTSLDLHLAETAVEDATRDILDRNFGQAEAAINSALGSLKHASEKNPALPDLTDVKGQLRQALDQAKKMDSTATLTLNEADRQIRRLIEGQSH
jgi:hypothetical protein